MAGTVFVDGQKSDKCGTKIDADAKIEVREDFCPYVGRGGFKLEKALKSFKIGLNGAVCADIGASTGGFTDCMLQNGAARVYAVDVGYGQLAWKLRTDERVVNIERCNVRYMDPGLLDGPVDFASADVSFISLRLILPVMKKILKPRGCAVVLVKPQFEAGREEMRHSRGIVRDDRLRAKTIRNVAGYAEENGLIPAGLDFSPVTGTKGNIEYLMFLRNAEDPDAAGAASAVTDEAIRRVVASSREALTGSPGEADAGDPPQDQKKK